MVPMIPLSVSKGEVTIQTYPDPPPWTDQSKPVRTYSIPFPTHGSCLVAAGGPSTRKGNQTGPIHTRPIQTDTVRPRPASGQARPVQFHPMIQRNLTLRLTDIYGGDGFERPHTVEEVTLEESKTTITVRKDLGVPVEKERERKQVTEKEVAVRTFKRDDDGTPMYRLGGVHGKFWGLLRETGYNMYQTGEQENKITTDRVLKAVQIQPQWCRLEGNYDIEMDVLPQELEGRSNAMVEHYFDVVPQATTEVTITHPEAYDDILDEYIERCQTMNFGNKRRGTLTVIDRQKMEVGALEAAAG